MKTKKILLGTLVVLILSALYHDIYELFPNTITSFFFPIDESIWEHNKMILLAFITWAILEKISIKSSKNSLFKNLVACVTTIILVLTIFTPVFLFLLMNLPVGCALANEVHDVVAVVCLHNAAVTALSAGIKAPVIEGGDHLALIDLRVDAALSGVDVGGVLPGQIGKGVLGGGAGLPLGIQLDRKSVV